MEKDEIMNSEAQEANDVESIDLSIENNSDTIYPNAEVRVEKAQFSISHLQTMCRRRNELILNPDFQRNEVWKSKQESELVESILMGIPIPLMYLFEDKRGKKQVVDGRQRISAILDFLEGKTKLNNLKILSQLNGCYFKDLEPLLQGKFEDYQLLIYIIQPPTPERVKYDIFDRVNRGGTSLNKQEMRNALYQGKCTSLLKYLCDSPAFLQATGYSINSRRMKDQYVVLRALSFLMLHRGVFARVGNMAYKGDIDDFLARFMIFINEEASDELIDEYVRLFIQSTERCLDLLGENGFRFSGNAVRRPINMPLLEALIYFFSYPIEEQAKEYIVEALGTIKKEFDHSNYFSGNIDSTTSVYYRFAAMDELLKRNNHDK